ncbi:autophagy protein 2 [Klebsormidium nitens]|uniref:Autophagy-related protein 2 n=1 Tax=Klebsormidium nitens TaxID=105231 RepID=A0A1Y1IEB1_KLENI|nr:autophagy protein 2 [Klebsormidium nitens]|eukprot:GAQ87036.1 autophagy protein 2 [Klebsormidium nitens]
MFSASSWAMKRVYKFLLKRLLGKLLVNEIDLEQLEVQLGAGTLELRDLLLDTNYLNAQLGEAAAVTISTGYIGTIKATVPWKGLASQSIEIDIDELEITVAPRVPSPPFPDEQCDPQSSSNPEGFWPSEEPGSPDTGDYSRLQAYAGVDDGVRVVARLVESILLGLRVRVMRLVIRVEHKTTGTDGSADSGGCTFVVRVPFAEYKDETPVASSSASGGWGFLGGSLAGGLGWGADAPPKEPTVMKTVSFKGVEVALERPAGARSHQGTSGVLLSGANGGADGSVRVWMHWKSGAKGPPKLDLELLARPLELRVDLADVSTLSALAAAFSGGNASTSRGKGFVAPGIVQKERALHELAGSGLLAPAGVRNNPTGVSGSPEGGFRARKEDLLQSQYFSQQQAEDLRRSVGAGDEWVSEFGDAAPGWLRSENGGAEEEADLAASVDDFFDCINGTASGHLSRSSHSSGRRSVTWAAPSETRSESSTRRAQPIGEIPAVSPSTELNRPGFGQVQGTPASRQALPDPNASSDPHFNHKDSGTNAVASYSARAKIAGLKVILLAPGDKRKRKGSERCQGGDRMRAPPGGGGAGRLERRGAAGSMTQEAKQRVAEVARESGQRREENGSVAESDCGGARGLGGCGATAVRNGGDGGRQPEGSTGEATGVGRDFQSSRRTDGVRWESRPAVEEGPICYPTNGLGSWAIGDLEHGSMGFGEGAHARSTPEEDDFSDALGFAQTDGPDFPDDVANAFSARLRTPGRAGGIDDVSNADSGSRDEFGSANDVLRLETDCVGGFGTRGSEPPGEIVEREWSPEPTEQEAVELREKVAAFPGGLSTGRNAGGVHADSFPGGLNPGEVLGGRNGGEVALEMPLENESEEEDGYGMRPAESHMASVFGRDSLLAWSGAGLEHWNGGGESEGFGGLADDPPEGERGGLRGSTLEDRAVSRGEESAGFAADEITGSDDAGMAGERLEEGEEADEKSESPRDFLEAVCTNLSFSVAVSGSSTSIEIASDTLEIAETLHTPQVPELGSQRRGTRNVTMPPPAAAHEATPREQQLQQVEAALPSPYGAPQPFARTSAQTRTSPFAVPFKQSQNGSLLDTPPSSDALHVAERRRLVKVRSGPPVTKPAVVVKVLISSGGSTGRTDGGQNYARGKSLARQSSLLGHSEPVPRKTSLTEVKAELQPVTLFLDLSLPKRLKRFAPVSGVPPAPAPAVTPVPLLRASQVLPSPRRSFEDFLPSQVLPRPGSSPVDDIIDDLDRQFSGGDAGMHPFSKPQRGALSISVSSSCFRVILSFPKEDDSCEEDAAKKLMSRTSLGAPCRRDFLALDLFSGSSPDGQPAFLSYKIDPPETSLRRSFSSIPPKEPESSVSLGAANLGLYLVTDSHFATGGSVQSPGYRAFSLLSVSKQPGHSARQKAPRKHARLFSPVDATGSAGLGISLDVRMRPGAESGDWLAQSAWEATSAQKTRGDGGSGVDNNQHGEAAAARASAADEDLIALEIREKAIASSAASVQLSLDRASIEVVRWRLERLGQLLEAVKRSGGSASEDGVRNGVKEGLDGRAESRVNESGEEGRTKDQFAFLLNVAALELRLFDEKGSKGRADDPPAEEPDVASEKDKWVSFRGDFSELTFFHVSNLGGAAENSYMWIRHERCGLYGTLQSPTPPESGAANGGVELLLLTCSNEVLGRGDAGDENALASPGTVGLTVSVIAYPSGGYETDSIVACSLRGGTVMAPMGRLDWVLAVKELAVGAGSDGLAVVDRDCPNASESVGAASDYVGKASEIVGQTSESATTTSESGAMMSESVRPTSESVCPASETYAERFSRRTADGGAMAEADTAQAWPPSEASSAHQSESRSSQASGSTNGTCFLLDLHDLALCYEPNAEPNPQTPPQNPGKSFPPDSRPSLSRQNSSSNVGSSVSAVLAVAALRVSSVLGKQPGGSERVEEEGGEAVQEQVFDVWLRDAALLILDNAMRRPAGGDFTTSSLAQAGFVQVAREGVLEACIRTHTGEGLQWELDCTHNQLRLDTCQDTTAALGRLAGQIQALIQADMEPVAVAGGGAVIHRQYGDQDPSELLRTLSEGSQDSAPPSLSSSLASETFRGPQTEREVGGTTRASREEAAAGDGAKSGFNPERRGAAERWEGEGEARAQSESCRRRGNGDGPSHQSEERLIEECDGLRFAPRKGWDGVSAELSSGFSNPSRMPPKVGDKLRSGRPQSSPGGDWETEKEAGALPGYIENFYQGLDGRAPPGKPGSSEGFHTVPPSQVKQPIWSGDPVSVSTPRTQHLYPEEASEPQVPSRPRKPVRLSKPNVNRRKSSVKEHDASWFDGKMPPLSEDYVVRPSGSPPKEDLGRPWLRNRGPGGSKSRGSLPRKYPKPVGRLLLRDLSVRWRLYGGRDWGCGTEVPESRASSGSRAGTASGFRQGGANQKRGESTNRPGGGLVTRSVKPTEDGLEGWSTVSVEPGTQASESPRLKRGAFLGAIQPPGRGGRQKENCLEVLLDGVDLQHDSFPQRDHYASRLAVSVRDITVYDFSKSAPWRMIMGHYRSASCPRESGSKALRVEMDAVRPNPASLLEEYRLLLALLPLRLHLDQRHIDFCADFFAGGGAVPGSPREVDAGGGGVAKQQGDGVEEAFLPFFQMFEMRPLTIRVDYLPRRIDLLSLRAGNYAELLNLVTWEGVELRLKGVRCAGVHGWGGLGAVLMNDWVEDISQHQLNKIVRGVAPIRPLYEVGRATAQLLMLPAEQYKKDKRLLKGLRKGAAAFLKGVSLEALGLGAQLAAGAHELLQQAEATLSGDTQPQTAQSPSAPNGSPLHISQPHGTREGLKQAFDTVSRGLERSASGVISAPIKRYQRSGSAGKAVATALRAAPAAVVAPAAATAGAVHRALLGVRNELDPERKREIDEKHAAPPPDGRRRS